MSDIKVSTPLVGYPNGPLFPEALEGVQGAYWGDNLSRFKTVLAGLGTGEGPDQWVTADGYHWHHGLTARVDGVDIAILFPFTTDVHQEDGTRSDRHIAVYAAGPVDQERLDQFLEKLSTDVIQGLLDEMEVPNMPERGELKSMPILLLFVLCIFGAYITNDGNPVGNAIGSVIGHENLKWLFIGLFSTGLLFFTARERKRPLR